MCGANFGDNKMLSLDCMNENNDAFLRGYKGEPALDSYYDDDLLYAFWTGGRNKAENEGRFVVNKKEVSIKVSTDSSVRLNYQRIPDCY